MKKILLTMVAALTAVTFTNCSKEEAFAPEQVGKPFELVASPETRTVNDGMATLWAEGDAVNVFHAVEGDTETFFNDGEFTLADVTTGTFTGTLTGDELTEDSSYDWYMFYPYSSYISTPANTSKGYMPVGSQSNASQAQTGINSMAHIAGSNYPMAGKVEGVMGGEKPHITMKHVSALVRVNVTNKNAEAINVTSVKLTAPEDIVGTYYINFAGETPEFTGSGDSYVSSTATLTVTDGVIEAGETASFYLAIKPIELKNGDLTVSVATEGNDLFAQTFTGLTTAFSAGKIKTINVAFEAKASVDYTSAIFELVTDASTLQAGDAIIIAAADANVAMCSTQDSNNRKSTAVTKSGNYILYPDTKVQIFKLEGGAGAWEFNTGNGYIFAASSSSNHLKTQTTNDANGKWNIVIDSAGTMITATGENSRNTMQYNATSDLFSCYSSSSQGPVVLYKYSESVALTPLATPVVTATVENTTEIVVSWTAVENAASYEITCGDEKATVTDATTYTFTGLNYNTEYTIFVTAIPTDTANYMPSTGTATATTGENQNVASGTATYDFTAISGFSSWSSSYAKHTVTYDEGEVIFTSANKQSGTITNMPVTKGQPVEFKLTNGATLTKAELICKQWSSKAQTITMHYSTDGGSNYTTTGVTSSNFTITNDALPAGTNAIKFTFSSTNNQIGIQSLTIAYE